MFSRSHSLLLFTVIQFSTFRFHDRFSLLTFHDQSVFAFRFHDRFSLLVFHDQFSLFTAFIVACTRRFSFAPDVP